MPSVWARWVRAVSATEDGTSLALFRIAIGLCVLLNVGAVVWGGIVEAVWLPVASGGMHQFAGSPLIRLLGGPTPGLIYPWILLTLVGGLGVAVGFGGRIWAFVTLQLTLALVMVNPYASSAYDPLLTNGLWLVVLGDARRTLSVDCRWRTGRWTSDVQIGKWARYLVVLQIVVLYAMSGVQKLSAHWVPWGDLSAIYDILMMPSYQRQAQPWIAHIYPLTQLATAVTWIWEISAPLILLAVWRTDDNAPSRWAIWLRRIMLGLGITMHITLWFFMELGPFGATSLAFYFALVHPWEWRRVSRRALLQ